MCLRTRGHGRQAAGLAVTSLGWTGPLGRRLGEADESDMKAGGHGSSAEPTAT